MVAVRRSSSVPQVLPGGLAPLTVGTGLITVAWSNPGEGNVPRGLPKRQGSRAARPSSAAGELRVGGCSGDGARNDKRDRGSRPSSSGGHEGSRGRRSLCTLPAQGPFERNVSDVSSASSSTAKPARRLLREDDVASFQSRNVLRSPAVIQRLNPSQRPTNSDPTQAEGGALATVEARNTDLLRRLSQSIRSHSEVSTLEENSVPAKCANVDAAMQTTSPECTVRRLPGITQAGGVQAERPARSAEQATQCDSVVQRVAGVQACTLVHDAEIQTCPWFHGRPYRLVDDAEGEAGGCRTPLDMGTQTLQTLPSVRECGAQTDFEDADAQRSTQENGTQTLLEDCTEYGVQTILTGSQLPDPCELCSLRDRTLYLEEQEAKLIHMLGSLQASLKQEELRSKNLTDSEASLCGKLAAANARVEQQRGHAEELQRTIKDTLKGGMNIVVSAPRISIAVGTENQPIASGTFPASEIERAIQKDLLPRYQRLFVDDGGASSVSTTIQGKMAGLSQELCIHLTRLIADACPACEVKNTPMAQRGVAVK